MLRSLYKSDLSEILNIEKSVHVVPWTEDTFKVCFQTGYVGWVVEVDKRIIGFIIISLTREECHILNVGVGHDFQHQGYGFKLVRHVLLHAKSNGIGIAYLEVRRSNTRAITLYRRMGFHFVGERKEYYPSIGGNEDALIFAISLNDYT
jgi:[ribosomal protein S18]-alanine N-acetyltransferase